MKKNWKRLGILIITLALTLVACTSPYDLRKPNESYANGQIELQQDNIYNQIMSQVPPFEGEPYVTINNNNPYFSESDLTNTSYEKYSQLDELGRCGVAMSSVGKDLMPTEKRGSIGKVKPTGWETVKYESLGNQYLYNRCHLIGYQLTAENANEKNLITGTRYLNVDGMLPFENIVADYVEETNNHVLYRVTPLFDGDNLVADGVLMEAMSVEDGGEAICFNVFCYNVQPGIIIDYETGKSVEEGKAHIKEKTYKLATDEDVTYVLNKNGMKFHKLDCGNVKSMKAKNKEYTDKSREELIELGYSPCGSCKP